MKPKLLYISVNDGTDTRIVKELCTLTGVFDVTFVGVCQEHNGPNRLPDSVRQIVITGRRKSALTLTKLFILVYKLSPSRFSSVHIVNENLLIALFPLLLSCRNLVLDIFDSMFLKGIFSTGLRFLRGALQWLLYSVADTVLVTDEDRRRLLPAYALSKTKVLPNFPSDPGELPPRRVPSQGDPLRIFFSGSLTSARGAKFLESLLEADSSVEVVAAGWVYDDDARSLCQHPRVSYRGVVSQAEAAGFARQCDYILCLYAPDVLNNIYASPNKIYDAALVGVPVIINSEIRAADFVARNGLGVVIPSFSGLSPHNVIAELLDRRCEFKNLSALSSPYKWSAVETVLIDVHST